MLIELKDVCYIYGEGTVYEVSALSHISLGIGEGEFVGVRCSSKGKISGKQAMISAP